MPKLLHELLDEAACAHPDTRAVSAAEGQLTYAQLAAASRSVATRFASLSVKRGDRVLILLENSLPTVIASMAASRLGAIFSIINPEMKDYLLRHLLTDSTPALIVTTKSKAQQHAFRPRHQLLTLEDEWQEALTAEPWKAPAHAISLDPACLFYTSGTTDRPKGIVSPHNRMLFAVSAIQRRLRYRAEDVIGSFLPMSFDYGFYQFLLAAAVGASLALGSPLENATAVVRRLREWGASVFPATPSLVYALVKIGGRRSDSLPPIRVITNTGSHLPASDIADVQQLLPHARIYVMFGLTECKRVSILEPEDLARKPDSVGRPLDDTECIIVDDVGRVLPPGQIGELVVRGPHVMAGYWNAPEETAKRFRHWRNGLEVALFSGDRASMDPDGFLYFHGRNDELYKQRGYRVSAAEVEAAAMDVPGVRHAAVLKPTAARGAVLVTTGAIDATALLQSLRERVEDFRIPEIVEVRASLPFTSRGKIDKVRLAAEFDARSSP